MDYGYTIETNFYLPMVTVLSTTGQSIGEFNAENFWEFKWELVEDNVNTPIENIPCKELIYKVLKLRKEAKDYFKTEFVERN